MKTLKNIIIFVIFNFSLLFSCGGGSLESHFSKENQYNFLDASLVGLQEANPLYSLTSYGKIYSYEDRVEYYKEIKRQENVKEWHGYLKGTLSIKEIDDLLYSDKGSLMERYKKYKK